MKREPQPNPIADALDRLTAELVDSRRHRERHDRDLRLSGGVPVRDRAAAHDTFGRKIPRNPMNAVTLARALPGYIEQFSKRVPAGMFSISADSTVQIDCPCGAKHHAELGVPTMGVCGRHFIYDGREVRVAAAVEGNVPAET